MKEILQQWGTIIAVLGLIGIEISPIKINPLGWLFRALGKAFNRDLIEKVDIISAKVNKIEKDNDFKEISDIKNNLSNYHVLLGTVGLDENQYRRCFELEQKYKEFKDKYKGEVNGHMDTMIEAIHENYKKGNIRRIDLQNK